MAKFKIGDKVRLKKGLEVGKIYGGIMLLDTMIGEFEKAGGVVMIKQPPYKVLIVSTYRLGYNFYYFYTEEMLELVEE